MQVIKKGAQLRSVALSNSTGYPVAGLRPAESYGGIIDCPAKTARHTTDTFSTETWSHRFALCGMMIICLMLMALNLGGLAPSAYAAGPDAPVATDPFADAVSVDLADGLYLIDVSLEGGSGRASVESPAEFEVFDGRGVVRLVWSSKNYDYMLVGGKKYLNTNSRGNSVFTIPVTAYDEPVAVVGDTTAMNEAHEVDYTLTAKFDSVQPYDETKLSKASTQALSTAQGASSSASSASSSSSSGAGTASPAGELKGSSASGSESVSGSSSASSSSAAAPAAQSSGISWPWIVFIVCAVLSAVAIGITIGIIRGYRG